MMKMLMDSRLSSQQKSEEKCILDSNISWKVGKATAKIPLFCVDIGNTFSRYHRCPDLLRSFGSSAKAEERSE